MREDSIVEQMKRKAAMAKKYPEPKKIRADFTVTKEDIDNPNEPSVDLGLEDCDCEECGAPSVGNNNQLTDTSFEKGDIISVDIETVHGNPVVDLHICKGTEETEKGEFFTGSLRDYYKANTNVPFFLKSPAQIDITIHEMVHGVTHPKEDESFVIIQDGGVGDTICATALVNAARRYFPKRKIVVGSAHSYIFDENPHIDKLYSLANPKDLYEKYVKDLRSFDSVRKSDLYAENAHKLFPGPLSMIWCYMYGVPWYGDNIEIFFTEKEEQDARDFISTFPRPVVVIHPYSARPVYHPDQKMTENKDWFDDRWEKLVERITEKYDVIQVGGPNEKPIKNVTTYTMGVLSMRATLAMLKHVLTFIAVDSAIAHAGPAVGKRGVVLFGRSNPIIMGHKMNHNVWVVNSCDRNDMFCGRPNGVFGDVEMFRGMNRTWNCPSRSCMTAITPQMVYEEFTKAVEKELAEGYVKP